MKDYCERNYVEFDIHSEMKGNEKLDVLDSFIRDNALHSKHGNIFLLRQEDATA